MKEMNETCEVKCTRSRLSRLLDREWSSRTESAHILCFCLSNMLCLTVLCYAMLCYAMLCYAIHTDGIGAAGSFSENVRNATVLPAMADAT